MECEVEARLASLERSNNQLRRALCLTPLLAVALVVGGAGQSVPDKLVAKEFELVDSNGKVLVRLANFDGVGAVTTYTPQGEILADIVPTKSGAGGMILYDGKGKQNIIFTDVTGGGGSIRVLNSESKSVASIGRNGENAGSITLNNKHEKSIVLLTGDTSHGGAMITNDADGKQTGRIP